MNKGTAESNDPAHQFLIQSNIDLPNRLTFGTVLRYIDQLPAPRVSGYIGLDITIGWQLSKVVELSIVAQNLLDKHHPDSFPPHPHAVK